MENNDLKTESVFDDPKANARKLKKEMNIELIERFMLRGVKNAKDIQKLLLQQDPPIKLTTRSIYAYKGIIIKRNAHMTATREGLGKSVEEMALDIKKTFEEVIRELWLQYYSALARPGDKIRALAEIRETTEKHIEKLQSLGLVFQAPVKHQMVDEKGKPVTPPGVMDRDRLAADFVAFMKAKYQDPVGSEKQVVKEKERQLDEKLKTLPVVAPPTNSTPLPPQITK